MEQQPEKKYKQCAFCREDILADAIFCKHCKSDLSRIKLNEYNEYVKLCDSCYSENKLTSTRCETCGNSLVMISDKEIKDFEEEKIEQKQQEQYIKEQEKKESEKSENELATILINFFIPGLGSTIFQKRMSKFLIAYLIWIVVAILLSVATLGCFLIIWVIIEIIVRVLILYFCWELLIG